MKLINNNNRGNEEDDDFDDDFSSKKDSSSTSKDAKNNGKASAVRSKHSVTEQRRRSKINERFQILRDLIPHGDQKRDTASFLLEVVEYVQILQKKVQKYEGSCQGWGEEPTKLMPWRHSHWRVQSYLSHPNAVKNGPGPASTITGKFDEKGFNINPSLTANVQAIVDVDPGHDALRVLDQPSELDEKVESMSTSFQVPDAVRIDGNEFYTSQQPATNEFSAQCAMRNDDLQGEHMIEGGTISISSAYSHGLLMTLTQALQSSGVDLSEASLSIRINLGKRANPSLSCGPSGDKDLENPVSQDLKLGHEIRNGNEELDQLRKKLKS